MNMNVTMFNLNIISIQGVVVENIARRSGGFLKKLSLRGCQSVGDSAMKTFAVNNILFLFLKL